MEFEPHGLAEKVGDTLGVLDRQVKGDLRRFKGFIEEHGQETGGWRGRVRPAGADTGPSAGDTPIRETPQSRMTGEGEPVEPEETHQDALPGLSGSLPADPDDTRQG
jgi:hypothetical protein